MKLGRDRDRDRRTASYFFVFCFFFLIFVLTEYIYRTYIYIIYLSFWILGMCVFKYLAGTGTGDDASWSSSLAQSAGQVRSFACLSLFAYRYTHIYSIYIYVCVYIYSYWLNGKKRLFRNCIHRFISKYFGGACFESRCESYLFALLLLLIFSLLSLRVSLARWSDMHWLAYEYRMSARLNNKTIMNMAN